MGFLFSGSKKRAPPEITGLQLQTAVNVLPIPLVYGCPRVPINIIYANGFHATKIKSSGGKGILSGGKGTTTGYNYFASFIGALCEGEIGPILGIFDDQMVYTTHTVPSGKNYTLFTGSASQAPVPTIVSMWPNDAFGYKDTAYIWCYNFPLDSSATVPQLNIIPTGLLAGSCPLNVYSSPDGSETQLHLDADPALVIIDFLTNDRYGVGFPISLIDQTTLLTQPGGFIPGVGSADVSSYCQAVGFGWSVCLNTQEPASSILERWLKNIVVAPVWTGTVLKFIPYYDTYADGNPGFDPLQPLPKKYYAPNVQPLFDLTDDDFIQAPQAEDPVELSRKDIADVKNVVRLDFRDRGNQFNSNVAESKNEVLAEEIGPRVDRMGQADEFSLMSYAQTASYLQLQRDVSIRNTVTFRLGWQWCILDPMDVVTVTDTTLGLNKWPCRITSIEEDEKGILTVVAEEFPVGSASATLYPTENNAPPVTFQTNVTPQQVNPPIIFEPTPQALAAEGVVGPQVAVALSAGPGGVFDPNWGGANILASIDNVTYAQIGQMVGASRMGVTTAILNAFAGTNPDNTNTLSVNLAESDSVLESVTSAQAASGLSVCVVQDPDGTYELLAYTTATLTGGNSFVLSGLYRGLYGTIACTHPSGSGFARLDSLVGQYPLPDTWVGVELFFKFQSFNIFFTGELDPSVLTVYNYTPNGLGFGVDTNPIWSALVAGLDVDLGLLGDPVTADLDLEAGGFGSCAPIVGDVDLGTV